MEKPNVSRSLTTLRNSALKFDIMSASFYLGRSQTVSGFAIGHAPPDGIVFTLFSQMPPQCYRYFHLPGPTAWSNWGHRSQVMV